MTHFPHMMSFVLELSKEKTMYDFEDVNAILADLAEKNIVEHMAEPIDEPDCHPLDWAEVVGIADEIFDEIYPEANCGV